MSDTRNHTTRDQLADLLAPGLYEALMEVTADHWRQWRYLTPAAREKYRNQAAEILEPVVAAVRAAAVAETTAAIEALAAKWERQEYKPGAFYPEAIAYADGRDNQAEACADEIREVLSGGRTALDTILAQARAEAQVPAVFIADDHEECERRLADLREQIARGIEDSRDRNQGNPAALAYLTHAAAIARHGRVEGADQ